MPRILGKFCARTFETINITDQLILLDGHIRLIALQELGYIEVPCLVATDDESYTYNSRIN